MSDRSYFSPFLRSFLQVLLNIALYTILSNLLYNSTQFGMEPLFYTIKLLMIISVSIALSSILLKSFILGFINTTLLLYVVDPSFFTNPLAYMYVLMSYLSTFIILLIIVKLLALKDSVIEYMRSSETPRISARIDRILGNYALYFASTSILLPITLYILVHVEEQLNSTYHNNLLNPHTLLTYFVINTLISLTTLTYSREPLASVKLGILSTLGAFSTIALTSLSLNEIFELGVIDSLNRFTAESSEEGILLGVVRARLSYGTPRRIYEDIKQEWIKGRRGKTWFWSNYYRPLYINPDKLSNRHIVIVGSSGSGKSLLAKHIILEYYSKRNMGFIVFDPHNEYYVLKRFITDLQILDASRLSLNPLELGRLNPQERAHQLSSIIMSLFRLGHLQRQAIEELIMKTYEYRGIYADSPSTWRNKPPTLHEVLDTCKKLMGENDLYRRIYPYIRVLADNVFIGHAIGLDKILGKPTIVVLNNLKSDYVRILYVDTFLQRLLDMMYRREIRGKHVIVLDEAYTLLTRDYSRNVVSRLLMESRKYGIGIIFITQHPLSIPSPIIENAAIKISFNIAEPRNLEYVSRMLSGVYIRDRVNMIRAALKNLKSLNYILTITGLNDIFIVSEEEIVKPILGDTMGGNQY